MRLVCAILLAAAVLPAQTLEGIVINAGTGLGVPGVTVQLGLFFVPGASIDAYPENLPPDTITDAAGRFRFSFSGVATVSVTCAKEGFEKVVNKSVKVTAGSDSATLRIAMVPQHRIAGSVVDGKGHPVPGVTVVLGRNGAFKMVTTGSAGRFDFELLPPGSYSLYARVRLHSLPPEVTDGVEIGWATTFYPGVMLRETASPVILDGSADITGLEIKLLTARLRHLRGAVLDPNGNPAPKTKMKVADGVERVLPAETFVADENGRFDVALVDGSWR